MIQHLRIATRKSPLALWQANFIKDQLKQLYPELEITLVGLTTEGDKILHTPLATKGGKGLFVKELEQALLDGQADIAVHSMKDVPMQFPPGLKLAVICEREDPRDVLVSCNYNSLNELPVSARVGTSSLRRQSQLKAHRPDLNILTLRGNVHTRLAKLDAAQFDAIVLAAAGLKRLGLLSRLTQYLDTRICLPSVGQGAIGIETCDNAAIAALLQPLNHPISYKSVMAERAMNAALNGGCQVPVAGYAEHKQGLLHIQGLVAEPNGKRILRSERQGPIKDYVQLGQALAEDLLQQGAAEILQKLYTL